MTVRGSCRGEEADGMFIKLNSKDVSIVYASERGGEHWDYRCSHTKDKEHRWNGNKCYVSCNLVRSNMSSSIASDQAHKSMSKVVDDAVDHVCTYARVDAARVLDILMGKIQKGLENEQKRMKAMYGESTVFMPYVFVLVQMIPFEQWIGGYGFKDGCTHFTTGQGDEMLLWRRIDGKEAAVLIAFH